MSQKANIKPKCALNEKSKNLNRSEHPRENKKGVEVLFLYGDRLIRGEQASAAKRTVQPLNAQL